MTKEKIYKDIEERRLDSRMQARFAIALYEKLKPMLPLNWDVGFNISGWLQFTRWKVDKDEPGRYVAEFKLVRNLLAAATGSEFKPQTVWSQDGSLLALKASGVLPLCDIPCGRPLYIDITLYETSECRVLVREKTETVKEGELLDDCLGGNR